MNEMPTKTNEALQKARAIVTGYRGKPLRIMEVCGTHTHEIFRLGLRQLLPADLTLISGPGCPVCVTPVRFIDEALYLALQCHVTICTFGDLVRVPGTKQDLGAARAQEPRAGRLHAARCRELCPGASRRRRRFPCRRLRDDDPGRLPGRQACGSLGLTNFTLLTANKTMDAAYLAMSGSCDATFTRVTSVPSRARKSLPRSQARASRASSRASRPANS